MTSLEEAVENAGVVERYPDIPMALKRLNEGQVGLLVCLLRHKFEIADWLVIMDGENKLNFRHVSKTLFPLFFPVREIELDISLMVLKCQ
jgi:hypothetical protein